MNSDERAAQFWQLFLASLQPGAAVPAGYQVWHFCSDQESADHLGALAASGIKTATTSLIWSYEAEQEPLPKVGDHSIIITWDGQPLCVIKTVQARQMLYNQVDPQFAYDEGEGDRSLDYWRRVHWQYFSEECRILGREPSETMPVLCERFEVVYP